MELNKIFQAKIDFFKLFREQTEIMIEAVKALSNYSQTAKEEDAEKVKELEKLGDQKRFELVQDLDKTFITPYDREDIYQLSKCLDDILDYYKTTIKEMEVYQIGQCPELSEFFEVLITASDSIYEAVLHMEKEPTEAMQDALKAKKCENKVESLYRHSVMLLLESDDFKYIIKMREIYRHLSNCADRIDQTSDLICHILMKSTA